MSRDDITSTFLVKLANSAVPVKSMLANPLGRFRERFRTVITICDRRNNAYMIQNLAWVEP